MTDTNEDEPKPAIALSNPLFQGAAKDGESNGRDDGAKAVVQLDDVVVKKGDKGDDLPCEVSLGLTSGGAHCCTPSLLDLSQSVPCTRLCK